MVATAQRRGAEVFASDLVRWLAAAGVSQRVAVVRGSDGAAVTFEAPTTVLPRSRLVGPRLPGDPRTLLGLRRLVRAWGPDVVQAHGGEALKYAVPAAGGRATGVVYRRIGSAHPSTTAGLRRAAYGFLIRRAARVVAVAEAVRRETMAVFRVPGARVATIPNAVDEGRLRPARGRRDTREALGLAPDAPVVLSVGALTWEKDPLAQLGVAARVGRARPDAVCVMVGDGPLRARVEGAVRDRGLSGRVVLLGARADVADLLAASDVLVLASRTEGMPASVIEAGMLGLPVAAYAVGGVAEVVEDGATGLLAPPGDAEALARCLVTLLEGDGARVAMGRAARERCRARFRIDAVAPRYLALYEELTRVS